MYSNSEFAEKENPKTKRFAANRCCVKLFQVSVGRSSHTVFFSLLPMIAKEEKVKLRGANGSPKTAGILSMPASQAAVRHRIAGSGSTPAPPVSLAEKEYV